MESYFTHDLILHLIGFQSVIFLIMISNIWIMRRARRHPPPSEYPLVSILVPARNEERNISSCVQSLLAQDYPRFEVLVLDDQSTDRTRTLLEEMARSNPALIILEGQQPPEEQIGKNWACTQLANQAKGELLFFTDADTLHRPQALMTAVTTLLGENAALVTGFPRQEVGSWVERLLVPFFSWVMICFNPLWLAYRLRLPALSGAVGQMMLFRREAYFDIGGHRRVRTSIVDDFSLARNIISSGFRWRVVYISDRMTCRMYQSSLEAYNGFVKNFFAVFDFRFLPYLFSFFWLMMMFWSPIIVLALRISGHAPLAQLSDLLICIVLSLLLWLIPYFNIQVPFYLAFLYPINISFVFVVALQSLQRTITGNMTWKGRKIIKQNWRWL
jgi:chlorobactene glucosyltransferase